MATGRGTNPSLAAWGLAGVPILATLVQTTLALLETTLGSAGLTGVQDAIRSIEVFDAGAILLWKSPAVLGGLFVLIAGAWVAQGVTQFAWGNRDLTFAAAGLVSVLFFALFFGVYSPMFGMDVPTVQLVGFFAVPVLASGAAIGSAFAHDWDEKVREEKSAELAELASEVERKRETFEDEFERRIGDVSALDDVAPTGVERTHERRREFREQCEDVEADVEAARGGSPEELRSEAASLRRRVEELDPEAEVERIDSDLRDRVASGVLTTYGSVQCWSRYDQTYELVNLPGRFREVEISAFDVAVHVDRISETLVDRIEDDVPLQRIGAAIAEIDDHVDRVTEHVADREADFAETVEAAQSDLETVRTKRDRFDGGVADRLSELLVDGRHDDLPSVRGVEDRIAKGKDLLHQCRFDDAEREAEQSVADAGGLVTLVEFLWSVVGTVDHGGERVSLPSGLDPDVVAEFRPAFEREYDVTFEVTDDAVRLDHATGATAGGTTDADPTASGTDPAGTGQTGDDQRGPAGRSDGPGQSGGGSDPSEQVRPGDVVDEVLFVFRELKTASKSTDDERAELQTDNLPETIAKPAVFEQIEKFGQRQTDVLDRIDVQENAPPGFVELVPSDGVTVDRAVDALHERYQEQHG